MAALVNRLYLRTFPSCLTSSKTLHCPFPLSPMFQASLAAKSGALSSYITSGISYEQLFNPEPRGWLPLPPAVAKTPVSYRWLPPASYSYFNGISPSAKTWVKAAFGTCASMGLESFSYLCYVLLKTFACHFRCHSLE